MNNVDVARPSILPAAGLKVWPPDERVDGRSVSKVKVGAFTLDVPTAGYAVVTPPHLNVIPMQDVRGVPPRGRPD